MSSRIPWNDTENMAITLAYCIMAQASARGEKFNKSAIRRELRGTEDKPGPLFNRSNGSLEAKLMNCTAVAERYGFPTVPGYKAAPNYQSSLARALAASHRLVEDEQQHGLTADISIATEI